MGGHGPEGFIPARPWMRCAPDDQPVFGNFHLYASIQAELGDDGLGDADSLRVANLDQPCPRNRAHALLPRGRTPRMCVHCISGVIVAQAAGMTREGTYTR